MGKLGGRRKRKANEPSSRQKYSKQPNNGGRGTVITQRPSRLPSPTTTTTTTTALHPSSRGSLHSAADQPNPSHLAPFRIV